MDRVNRIINNKKYKEYLERINIWEKDREFCRHNMVHFLDVCRLAEIMWLEDRLSILEEKKGADGEEHKGKKERLYAAGLLHDIGRWQQYEEGIPHEEASAALAPAILRESGFLDYEIEEIVQAILNHRNKKVKDTNSLSGYIYRADKKSRACFACQVQERCNWPKQKKNLEI